MLGYTEACCGGQQKAVFIMLLLSSHRHFRHFTDTSQTLPITLLLYDKQPEIHCIHTVDYTHCGLQRFSGWLSKNRDENPRMRALLMDFELKIMRMRGFSSHFLDNPPENRCTHTVDYTHCGLYTLWPWPIHIMIFPPPEKSFIGL